MRGARSFADVARTTGVLCLAIAGTAGALTTVRPDRAATPRHPDTVALTARHGAMLLDNSRAGTAIFGGSGLAPGESVSGDVQLTAPESFPSDVSLSLADLVENLGPANVPLSSVLQLRVVEDPPGGGPLVRYSGLLRDLGTRSMDAYAAGETRTYRFVATLPDVPAANQVQGTSATASFTWNAQERLGAPTDPPGTDPAAPGADAAPDALAPAPIPSTTTPGVVPTTPGMPQRPGQAPPLLVRLVLPVRQQAHQHKNTVMGWAICSRACRLELSGRATDARAAARGRPSPRAMTLRAVPARRGVANRRARLTLKLTPAARAALERGVSLRVRVWVRATDAAGRRAETFNTTRVTR
jgi:hypothetical protein